MKRKGGLRRKTRHKLKKGKREKGRLSLKNYFQAFNVGERVVLAMEPAVHKGIYHPMHSGKSGIIAGKRGRCYEISIKDGYKEKTLIVHPVHLRRL